MLLLSQTLAITAALAPLSLHPQNPRVFEYQGKPTLLITSGEHYGAVLNLDFDYVPYLDELARHGLNQTRTFSGTYREVPGSFGIKGNTLAPANERYACPWARSDQPGYRLGGNKFDLTRFDDAYFGRLRDFVGQAERRGIVVEYVLFCPFYDNGLWLANPMHVSNNVNGVGAHASSEAYTMAHADLQAIQEAFVRKAVTELNGFDNVYFEIANEPYFGGITLDWQKRIAQVIVETEAGLPKRHLIAQNIANNWGKVDQPDPNVSIFNYHYAAPPRVVEQNWHLNRPIGFDETGFAGSDDRTYRREAWQFVLAGGSEFSNLDYSFTADAESGTAKVDAPGGGSTAYRAQLGLLKRFVEGLDLLHGQPLRGAVSGPLDRGLALYARGVPGQVYGLYLHFDHGCDRDTTLMLDLPAGTYRVDLVDVISGAEKRGANLTSGGGLTPLTVPPVPADLAVRVTKE
ncbi:MAG: hypothetical protein HZB16_17060 [Armatimonadetes bacterium]|nr:hypothetical protein [Armatimonadota bacterium]